MSWEPSRGGHAIERVAAQILCHGAISALPFEKIATMLQFHAGELGINELGYLPSGFNIQIPSSPHAGAPVIEPASGQPGRTFRRTVEGVVAEEIVFNANTLIFNATVYSRWQEFFSRLNSVLEPALQYITENVTYIREVKLEYLDRFVWTAKHPPANSTDLINPDSQYLSPIAKQANTSWHSHTGHFVYEAGGARTLINANVDVVVREPGSPLSAAQVAEASIVTLASAQRPVPSKPFESAAEIFKTLDERHDLLKTVLADIISPDLTNRISLNPRVQS